MLTLTNLVWIYPLLSMRFSLSLQAGERVGVLGPSGAGKSTLLDLIAGFLVPHSGKITLNGADHTYTPPARRPVSILFQENNLFMHLTVAQNIGLGIHPGLKLKVSQHQQVVEIAKRVGLESRLQYLPGELSSGQRQRAALARCLVREKPILLLDEPFSKLDPALSKEMLTLVDEVCCERQLTLLMVSHNLQDVQQIAVRSVLIVDGHISWDGTTEALLHGKTKAAEILGIRYRSV